MVVTTRSSSLSNQKESLQDAVNNLKASIHQPPSHHPPVSSKKAAVLIPLFEDKLTGAIHVILTQRASTLKTHAGEVCLPGGKRDEERDGDDDVATALRETQEELGILPGHITVLGTLPPLLSKHLLSVTPVVATVPHDLEFVPDPGEVSAVFSVPLSRFLSDSSSSIHNKGGANSNNNNHINYHYNGGYSWRDVEWEPGIKYRLHFFDVKYKNDGVVYKIWGLTAGILIHIAELAYGRRADFVVNPPGCPSYTALTYEHGRLAFRETSSGGGGGGGGSSKGANASNVVVEDEAAV